MRLAESAMRVEQNSSVEAIHQINTLMHQRIEYFRMNRDEIPERLRELDTEWDVERTLETGSSALSLAGVGMSFLTRSKKWLLVPLVVQGFFLQHALQGWCPPLPVLRRLGFRTVAEIEYERAELMSIQGQEEGHSQQNRNTQENPGPQENVGNQDPNCNTQPMTQNL